MEMVPSKLIIAYDEIIKQPGLYILRMIRDKFAEQFSEYINVDILQEIPDKDLNIIYAARNEINPLKWLAYGEFDYDRNYKSLHARNKSMYLEMDTTSLYEHMDAYFRAFFITDVYFWTRNYDKRVDFDIQYNFSSRTNKAQYITGPFDMCVDSIKPDIVFYPYINDIWDTIRKYRKTVFAIPTYGFNMASESLLIGQTDDDENVGYYPIIQSDKPIFMG